MGNKKKKDAKTKRTTDWKFHLLKKLALFFSNQLCKYFYGKQTNSLSQGMGGVGGSEVKSKNRVWR